MHLCYPGINYHHLLKYPPTRLRSHCSIFRFALLPKIFGPALSEHRSIFPQRERAVTNAGGSGRDEEALNHLCVQSTPSFVCPLMLKFSKIGRSQILQSPREAVALFKKARRRTLTECVSLFHTQPLRRSSNPDVRPLAGSSSGHLPTAFRESAGPHP